MIGRIRGKLVSLDEHAVLVDVAGVGYELEVTPDTLSALPGIGQDVALHTTTIRDDAHLLYGFATLAERDLFRLLIKVSGSAETRADVVGRDGRGRACAVYPRCRYRAARQVAGHRSENCRTNHPRTSRSHRTSRCTGAGRRAAATE